MSALPKTLNVTPLSRAKIRRDVERAAELQALIAPLVAELDLIKDSFKAIGDGVYLGREHKVLVTTGPRTSLDSTKVKARLSPADYVQCVVVCDVTRVVIKEV